MTCFGLTVDSPGFLEAVDETCFSDVRKSDDSDSDLRFDAFVDAETRQDRH